eukprot:750441_1
MSYLVKEREEILQHLELRYTNYVQQLFQQKSFIYLTRNSREQYDECLNNVDNLIYNTINNTININTNLLINNININNLINIPANPSPQSNTLSSSIPQPQQISEIIEFDEDSAQVKISYNLDGGNWVNYFWTHR